jgi:hypothetical protein
LVHSACAGPQPHSPPQDFLLSACRSSQHAAGPCNQVFQGASNITAQVTVTSKMQKPLAAQPAQPRTCTQREKTSRSCVWMGARTRSAAEGPRKASGYCCSTRPPPAQLLCSFFTAQVANTSHLSNPEQALAGQTGHWEVYNFTKQRALAATALLRPTYWPNTQRPGAGLPSWRQ